MILISGEWWTFEIGSFVTGSIDRVQLAAYNIVLNIIATGFVVRVVSGYHTQTNTDTNTYTQAHTHTHIHTHTCTCTR